MAPTPGPRGVHQGHRGRPHLTRTSQTRDGRDVRSRRRRRRLPRRHRRRAHPRYRTERYSGRRPLHRRSIPYGYRGLGDLFVFVYFGLVAVTGTYYVQAVTFADAGLFPLGLPAGTLPLTAVVASLPAAGLSTAILVVNNVRDRGDGRRSRKADTRRDARLPTEPRRVFPPRRNGLRRPGAPSLWTIDSGSGRSHRCCRSRSRSRSDGL